MADSLPHIPPALAKALLKRYPEVNDSVLKSHTQLIHEMAKREFVVWLSQQCEEQNRTNY